MSNSTGRITAGVYCAVAFAVTYITFGSGISLSPLTLADVPFLALLVLHALWGIILLLSSTEYRKLSYGALRRLFFVPELLGGLSLLLFLFAFIYALNANMDYVRRFVETGGALRIALDTRTERLLVWARLFPLVAVDFGVYLVLRVGRFRAALAGVNGHRSRQDLMIRPWAVLWILISAFLSTVAQPSFLNLDGFGVLAWIAMVPLFLVLRSARFGHGVFYLILFGTIRTLLTSYWLGTFSLVSLQLVVGIFLIYYLFLSPVAIGLHRLMRFGKFLVWPIVFTLFEYLTSIGFLGYPWALTGHSQYRFVPLIQMASVTGVWGVSFVVVMVNSALAEFAGSLLDRQHFVVRPGAVRRSFRTLVVAGGLVVAFVLTGTIALAAEADTDAEFRTLRVAQIQQNNDPRLSQFEQTFRTLTRLTDVTLSENPDIVMWSETAFVPNIRRWSTDESNRRLSRLVNEFLDYQQSIGTYLLTGNDDYEVVTDSAGDVTGRNNYNAAVLFDDQGERRQTYRKIKLVPFTEHFPYRELFPWAYELLLSYEVTFWEQGEDITVFDHPLVRFSTPICYEDIFPNYVRGMVQEGAELIANISNDYWSLTEVQAKQHFVGGLFRSVENRRPVIRTTASGLTGHIDPYGRILSTAPQYQEAFLVTDVEVRENQPTTIYTRWGDFFPPALAILLIVLLIFTPFASIPTERPATRKAGRSARRTVRATTPDVPRDLPDESGRETDQPAPAQSSDEAPETPKPRRGRRTKVDWRAIWDE